VNQYLFYVFGVIVVGASLGVIGQRNPMHSVLWLIASFVGLSGLYVLLDAPFTAVTQIIIYAGAIMVLFLFVVMLLNTPREEPPVVDPRRPMLSAGPRRAGALLALIFLAEILWAISRFPARSISGDAQVAEHVSSVAQIGRELFTTHVFAFEVTTVLLLVAMIGAVVLAKRVL
jgi:NADH-quinone oxidoreductase subunit J